MSLENYSNLLTQGKEEYYVVALWSSKGVEFLKYDYNNDSLIPTDEYFYNGTFFETLEEIEDILDDKRINELQRIRYDLFVKVYKINASLKLNTKAVKEIY